MQKRKQTEIAEQKYRPLKKRLKSFYKKIKLTLDMGRMPDSKIVAEFMTLAQIMTSYPGFGDEYYQDFTRACFAFEKAYRINDLTKAQESFLAITNIKKDCHHRGAT